ncbi:MAG TPA: HutD family protein [Steroidobacteraceae bacterium]|nr:HutD family protein [Steroidobacteraceae bacterium]
MYQVLRHKSYRAMPWRNGRGTTLEIAREPATGEEFSWRLSLADIGQDGDFSAYPGYSRAIALVAGERLHLRFRGHGHCFLNPTRRGTRFEGDWTTHCEIPKGRCTDLSLIVRRGGVVRPATAVHAPKVLRLEATRQMLVSKDLYGALFVLDGSVAIAESPRARARNAHAHDTILLLPGPRRVLTLRSLARSPAQLIFLRWRAAKPGTLTP